MERTEIYALTVFGIAVGIIMTVLGILHRNDWAYWPWILWGGVVVAVVSLMMLLWKLRSFVSGLLSWVKIWRFQWPLTRSPKEFSVQRFNHSRCTVDFGPLAENSYFTLTIFFSMLLANLSSSIAWMDTSRLKRSAPIRQCRLVG